MTTPRWMPDSAWMIGNCQERFDIRTSNENGWVFDWRSFYSGWLEGRFQMLRELEIYVPKEDK